MASYDPSSLPFSAGEIPDDPMNAVAFPQTPDPRPASGSHEPMNAPRVELHRHENFHQLNQVNVPKVELHQHDLRQLNQVYVAPQVDPKFSLRLSVWCLRHGPMWPMSREMQGH